MIVYLYDETNFRYTQIYKCPLDPLESELQGKEIFIQPPFSTTIQPPENKEGFDIVWNGNNWEYKEIVKPKEPEPYTPSAEELRKYEINNRLNALSQDLIQAQAGELVPDIELRKQEFIQLHNELRVLLGKEPREIVK